MDETRLFRINLMLFSLGPARPGPAESWYWCVCLSVCVLVPPPPGANIFLVKFFFWSLLSLLILVDSLHDFICLEVALFCVWRGCVIFLTHSLRLHNIFSVGSVIFFCGEVAWFFVERLGEFFSLCVGRLREKVLCFFWCKIGFVSEKKKIPVKSFFWWKKFFWSLLSPLSGCVIFLKRFCDFVCEEVAWFLCVETLCDFSHSVTQVAWFILLDVAWFLCVERLGDVFEVIFCVERLHDFFWWTGCVISFA